MRGLAKAWQEKYPDRYKELKKQWKSKPENRLHGSISVRVKESLAGKKLGRGVEKILGYSIANLRTHLERQFIRNMTLDNYGKWHVDHIVPLVHFDIKGIDCPDLKAAWALSNLRPLWAADNQRKHAKRTHLL